MPVAADIPAALAWLGGQLQADNSYQGADDMAIPPQATAETLRAQQALKATTGSLPQSLAFLDAAVGQPITELLARDLIAHDEANSPSPTVLANLQANQKPDGGFGGASGQFSNALDTAYALLALAKDPASNSAVIANGVNYLLSQQNPDGSFTQDHYAEDAGYITAASLMALHSLRLSYNVAQPISNAAAFLLSAQAANGGWGSDFDTAWALLALAPATTDTTPFANAVQMLKNDQLADGSWGDDVYLTALAARALQAVQTGNGTTPPWQGAVTGYVVDQSSGLPLGGVEVASDSGQSAATGADGSFLLQGITPGVRSFSFSLAGYLTANQAATVNAGQELALGTISMAPAQNVGIISGIVSAISNNQPLAGVSVTLSGGTNITAVTDAAGAYRLVVPPDNYTVTLFASGFLDTTASVTVAAGTSLTLSPSLTGSSSAAPTTANIYGTVLDANSGQPLIGVNVAVGGGSLTTVTDANGGFSLLGLQPGTWELDLSLSGYQTTTVLLIAPAGASNLGDIRLPPLSGTNANAIVFGTVTDAANGNPIAGAQIALTGNGTLSAVSNALGAYRIVAPPGAISVTASASGYLTVTGTATLTSGASLTFSPSLLAASATAPIQTTLTGTVVDAGTGQALAGVNVAVADGAASVGTDANGQFLLAGLQPGTLTLDLNLAGYQGVQLSVTASAGTSDLGTIRLPTATANGNTLTGAVTDSQTGQPLIGALVAIASEGKSARTAADGSYRLDGIVANQFTIAVSDMGYLSRQGQVSLAQPGLATLNITLDRVAGANVDIGSVVLDQPSYPARSKIKAQTSLVNRSSVDTQVRMYGLITNADGQIVDQFPAKVVTFGGSIADVLETVPANATLGTEIDWHNGTAAPGVYNFIAQAYDGSSGQLLAERSVPFTIQPTQTIGGSVTFDPPIALLAAQKPVHLTAKISNGGNLNLAGGTVTAKVTLKNAGYPSGNATLDIETVVNGGLLNYPRRVDSDANGDLYVANYNDRNLIRIDSTGTASVVTSGFYNPMDVDVAANGDIYVLNADGSYDRLAVDGSRQHVAGYFVQAIEAMPDGRIFVVSDYNNIDIMSPTGQATPYFTGSNIIVDIQSDAQGRLYIGDSTQGAILRFTGNALETIQTGLPGLKNFSIAADGTIAALYGSNNIALFTQDGGSRTELGNTALSGLLLVNNIYGLNGIVWGTDKALNVTSSGSTASKLIRFYPPALPNGGIGVGQVVYTATATLPALGLADAPVALDFGSWTPNLSGDFEADISVDAHPEYGVLSNTLHVGPNAYGNITVTQANVPLGDQSDQATIQVFGADSTSITTIDPAGASLAAISKTDGHSVAADSNGNLYASNLTLNPISAVSIVKITPQGVVSTFVSGYSFGYNLTIDNQNNLYAHFAAPNDDGTILKIAPDGSVAKLVNLGKAIRGLATGPDGLPYAVDAGNNLWRIHPDGQVELVTATGILSPYGLTIDAHGYFYIRTSMSTSHVYGDGFPRPYNEVIRISPDGKRSAIYLNQAIFENEGVEIVADCSNNLLFAPMIDYPFKTSREEDTILQLTGDTGVVSQVLYDTALLDMDTLYYDRFGQRLLIWTHQNGKIFSFPLICGGIDANVHLITRSDVNVSGITPAPTQSTDLGNGSTEYVWDLKQVDHKGLSLQFNLLLKGMAENESRPIAQDAYVEYSNSFVPGQNVRTPLTIPMVQANAMQIQPGLDASQYAPLSPVNINVNVTNSGGQPFSGQLQLAITDASGVPVQSLDPISINGQAGGSTFAYPALWNTSLFLVGNYQLQASLLNTGGTVVASGTVPFAIVDSPTMPTLTDTLNPDKLIYAGWDQVQLNGLVTNTAVNALLEPAVMGVTVTAPNGSVIYTGTTTIGELAVGNAQPVNFAFALTDAASGQYTVAVTVTRTADHMILDSFTKTFSVVSTGLQGLSGTVTATPNPVTIGNPVTCNEAETNLSASYIDSLSLTSLLVRLDNGNVITQASRSLALAGRQTDNYAWVADTTALVPGDYACVLQASINGNSQNLASATFHAVAGSAITLSGLVFHDLNHDQTQNANEPGTAADGVWITALGQGQAVASVQAKADGSYQLTVPGLASYTLVISTTANATTPALPIGWINTGETMGGTPDASVDGMLTLSSGVQAINGLNFAIDGAPSESAGNSAVTNQGVAVTMPVLANDWPGVGAGHLVPGSLDLNPTTPALDAQLAVPGEGGFQALADGRVSFTPLPGFSGASGIRYTVQDDLGQTTPASPIVVTVTGPANPTGGTASNHPHANPDTGAGQVGGAVTVNAIGNDVAGQGASLTAASLDLDPTTPAVDTTQTTPAGFWQANGDGTVTFTSNPSYGGLAQLPYAVTDSNGDTASSAIGINVYGGALVSAQDDSGATRIGQPITVAVFDNDHASAGQALLADSIDLDTSTPTVDFQHDSAEGHWQTNPNASVTFTPVPAYSGTATLPYTIADGAGLGATANLRITVSPNAPTALDDSVNVAFNTPATLAPAGNDTAAPGAILDPATLDLLPATDAVDTFVHTAQGDWQAQADGGVLFTPAPNQVGAIAPQSYLIRDSWGQAATANLVATVAPPSSIALSGLVFQDLNHSQTPNGNDPGSNAGGLLFVSAIGANANSIASAPVANDGGFQLAVPPLADYTLVLSTQANGAAASLPTGWRFTGESQAGASDGAADGRLAIHADVVALNSLAFGIAGLPPVVADTHATTPYAVTAYLNPLANGQPGSGANGFDPATLDLNPATPAIDSQADIAGQGVFAAQADGSVLFTPAPAFSGLGQTGYQVQDSLHQPSNIANLSVAVGPYAVNDSLGTLANTPVSGNLAVNDQIPPGAVYTLQTPPAHGTAAVTSNGGVSYTPASGYSGTDGFGYQVCSPAPDTGLCATAQVAVTITNPIKLQGSLQIGTQGRLLVLIDPPDKSCTTGGQGDDDSGDNGDSDSGDNGNSSNSGGSNSGNSNGNSGDDNNGDGQSGTACQAQQAERGYLNTVLQAGNWAYTLTDNPDDYTRAFRSGAYGLYALMSAKVTLDTPVQQELREAVNHGAGLLIGGDLKQRNGQLDTALGLQYQSHGTAYGLHIPAAPGYDHIDESFHTACTVNWVRPLTASVFGQFVDDHNKAGNCAVTAQSYGQGKAGYLGFDLPALAAVQEPKGQGPLSQLLLNLLDNLSPAPAHRQGDVLPLQLHVQNVGPAVNGWVGLALSGGASVYDPDGGLPQTDGGLDWTYSLATNASFGHQPWVRLPASGTAVAKADIHATGSTTDPYSTLSLNLPVADTPALSSAVAQLATLAKANKAYQAAYQSAQQATTDWAKGDTDGARKNLLGTANALIKIPGNDAVTVRQAIDEALRRLAMAAQQQGH